MTTAIDRHAPRLCAVLLDETKYCSPELVAKCGGKVFTLYWYDAAAAVHCCELTPSYCLTELATVPAVLPNDDAEREALLDICREVTEASDGTRYFHCHVINALPASPPNAPRETQQHRFGVTEWDAQEWEALTADVDPDWDTWDVLYQELVPQLVANGGFYY